MNTNIKIDGVMVLTIVGVALTGFFVYKVKGIFGLPKKAFDAINNAVPPGMSFEQKLNDGTTKIVTVSGEAIKKANANPTTMGMIAWPENNSANNTLLGGSDNTFTSLKPMDLLSGNFSLNDLMSPTKQWSFGVSDWNVNPMQTSQTAISEKHIDTSVVPTDLASGNFSFTDLISPPKEWRFGVN